MPVASEETARLNPPQTSWAIAPGLVRPASRGQLRLTGAGPLDPLEIDANLLGEPADMQALIAGVQLCREIGNSAAFRPFAEYEVMPGNRHGAALENFIRDAVIPYWHQTCTAKMGRDPMSVVSSDLKVHGIQQLLIADGSVMPRVTTGNTMAPCVVIGERAAEILRQQHGV